MIRITRKLLKIFVWPEENECYFWCSAIKEKFYRTSSDEHHKVYAFRQTIWDNINSERNMEQYYSVSVRKQRPVFFNKWKLRLIFVLQSQYTYFQWLLSDIDIELILSSWSIFFEFSASEEERVNSDVPRHCLITWTLLRKERIYESGVVSAGCFWQGVFIVVRYSCFINYSKGNA